MQTAIPAAIRPADGSEPRPGVAGPANGAGEGGARSRSARWLRGAANEQDAGRLLALLAPFQVLDLGPEEAKMAGALGAAADSRSLPRSRRPRPADMLIAGTAALHSAELVTCYREFAAFPESVRITILPVGDR